MAWECSGTSANSHVLDVRYAAGSRVKPTVYHQMDNFGYVAQTIVANKTLDNLVRAIVTRVYLVKGGTGYIPCPKPLLTPKQILQHLSVYEQRLLARTCVTPVIPLEEIPGLYFGPKRAIYQRAVDSLHVQGYDIRDAAIKAHTKVEKIEVKAGLDVYRANVEALYGKDPRVIQARTPRYNALLGRFLKPNEHRIFTGIDRVFSELTPGRTHKTVMKGLNARQQGQAIKEKWDMFDQPCAIRMDASRFDQHVSTPMLKFEHRIYHGLFRREGRINKVLLRTLLHHQLVNRCSGYCKDGRVRYVVEGNRMSGDMNTGLGNVIIMTSLVYRLFQELGNASRANPIRNLQLVNNGDDCSILCERKDVAEIMGKIPNFFLSYGFEMAIEGVADKLEQLKFCQCHPIYTPEGYIMVRDVRTAMNKDCISLLPMQNEKQYNNWRSAIAGCGLALTAGIPIAQMWYQTLGRSLTLKAPTVFTTGMDYLSKGLHPRILPIDPATRLSFYYAFGVLPDVQVDVESRLSCEDVSYSPTPLSRFDGSGGVWVY